MGKQAHPALRYAGLSWRSHRSARVPPVRYRDKPEPAPERGPYWMPIRGPDCPPFDTMAFRPDRPVSAPKPPFIAGTEAAALAPKLPSVSAPRVGKVEVEIRHSIHRVDPDSPIASRRY